MITSTRKAILRANALYLGIASSKRTAWRSS
jgi:hypothetical protein